jgi:hypothetical protein
VFSKSTRVTPAMGVALVALAFAVSGTSFAEGAATRVGKLMSGSKIKRGSLPGNRLVKGSVKGDRLKANSVTGTQVNEKTLATVPSALTAKRVGIADRATNAQRATNADNALALGGTAAAGYLAFATRAIPSGTTVTGAFGISSNTTVTLDTTPPTATLANDLRQVVQLPGTAPADLGDGSVNVSVVPGAADADPTCQGTATAPTAPAGKVCLYLTATQGDNTIVAGEAIPLLPGSRAGFVVHAVSATTGSTGAFGTWAYTAP